jgi:prepilin-type N-terminal cleavage/methylation domain-containing protein
MNRQKHSQAGYSLMEVSVVLLIAVVILLASFQLLDETTKITMFIESRNELPIVAQSAVNSMQTAISQSRQLFDRDSTGIGPAYFAALKLPTAYPLLTDSKLPLVNANGQFVPDTATAEYAGNCLLIARQLSPLTIDYGGTEPLSADRYRFELYYLTKRTNWKFSKSDGYIDAIRARSGAYADAFQLSNLTTLTDTQRKTINDKLIAEKVTMSWNPGATLATAFYKINSAGPMASAYTLDDKHKPDLSADAKSITPQTNGARVMGTMRMSVAFLNGTAKYPIPPPIPKYALFASGKPLYPSGMEFMIVGTANSRRVLARLAMMAHYHGNEYAGQEVSVITAPGR